MSKGKKPKQLIIDEYVYVDPFEKLQKERERKEIEKEYNRILNTQGKREADKFRLKNLGFGTVEC